MFCLYIDPGTGSMLFAALMGVFSVVLYFFREAWVKISFMLSGGRKVQSGEKLPVVIFSDDKRYWNVFEPICDEFESRGIDVHYMTASPDDPAMEKDYVHVKRKFIGKGNKAVARMNTLKAGVVLATTPNLDVFQWKRSKGVDHYVHIAHAADDITKYRMFGTDYYDSVLLGGKYQGEQIRKLEKLRKLPKKNIEYVGMPYMDRMKERADEGKNTHEDKNAVTVLLAPSWGESGILSRYGEKLIDILAEAGYELIIRPHPQSFISEKEILDALMNKYAGTPNISWNRDNDNYEVLKKADILISDFSGVIFDFALVFDKPVIYADTDFDKSPYDCYWLNEELWTFKILPYIGKKPDASNMNDIKALISECMQDKKLQAGRDLARKDTWMHEGEGAGRTVDYIEKIAMKEGK